MADASAPPKKRPAASGRIGGQREEGVHEKAKGIKRDHKRHGEMLLEYEGPSAAGIRLRLRLRRDAVRCLQLDAGHPAPVFPPQGCGASVTRLCSPFPGSPLTHDVRPES